jgi:hypothetical protein
VVQVTRDEHCAGGCPLGSFVSELAETPASRSALAGGFARWQASIVAALTAIGGTTPRADLEDLATTLLTALQGGLLLAQTTRSTRPLELVLDAAIDRIASRLTSDPRRTSATTRARRQRR